MRRIACRLKSSMLRNRAIPAVYVCARPGRNGAKVPIHPDEALSFGCFRGRTILQINKIFICAAALTSSVCAAAARPGNVDAARLQAADAEPQNWFTGGRDQDGTYFSPLKTINADNAKQLGFAWSYDMGQPQRGQEATPLVIDGVMYTSVTWGYVYAVDAATGKELWRYDLQADYFMGRNPCRDLVNPGGAVRKGQGFV